MIAPRALSNDRAHNEPNKAAGASRTPHIGLSEFASGLRFFSLSYLSWAFSLILSGMWIEQRFLCERFLPMATREFLLWFADDVLPQPAPAIKWANAFGATWNGLLTFISFVLAVLSIILALALSRGKKGTELKGASAFFVLLIACSGSAIGGSMEPTLRASPGDQAVIVRS